MLLTNKKPEMTQQHQGPGTALAARSARVRGKDKFAKGGDGEAEALRLREPGEDEVVWQLGEDSDEEDRHDACAQEPGAVRPRVRRRDTRGEDGEPGEGSRGLGRGERTELMEDDIEEAEERSGSSSSTRVTPEDEFGEWKEGPDSTQ